MIRVNDDFNPKVGTVKYTDNKGIDRILHPSIEVLEKWLSSKEVISKINKGTFYVLRRGLRFDKFYTRNGLRVTRSTFFKYKNKPRICLECKTKHKVEDLIQFNDKLICKKCLIEVFNHVKCSDCGKFTNEYTEVNHGSSVVCSSCLENYSACESCGDMVSSHHRAKDVNDNRTYSICDDCAETSYKYCSSCDYYILIEHRDEDTGYCLSCVGKIKLNYDGKPYEPKEGITYEVIKSTRTYGIELETDYHKPSKIFNVVRDGSIDGDEYVSKVLRGDYGVNEIKKFNKEQRNINSCNYKTGYHLHIGIKDYTYKDVLKCITLMSYIEDYFFALVSSNRYGNNYCRKLVKGSSLSDNIPFTDKETSFYSKSRLKFKQKISDKWSGFTRYFWLNFHPYFEGRETLEIRMHHGTIDDIEIVSWIRLWTDIVDYIKEAQPKTLVATGRSIKNKESFIKFIDKVTGDKTLADYYSAKFRDFTEDKPKARRLSTFNQKQIELSEVTI